MIVVRDRREPRQFSVANVLVDEWYPLLGSVGFVLYTFYVRLSNRKDERAFPGYQLIRRHFGFSRATIARYNRLLVWCQLIHIEEGNEHKANEYFILEVPAVDVDAIERVRSRVLSELDSEKRHEAKFRAMLLRRLDEWKPIQHWWWKRGREGVVTVTRAQLELGLQGVDGGEGVVAQENHPSFPGKPPQFPRETRVVH